MKPTKKKRVRRPSNTEGFVLYDDSPWPIAIGRDSRVCYSIIDARKLAHWITRACDYLEQKEAKR